MKKQFFLLFTVFIAAGQLLSQTSKPPLDFSVYDHWNRITGAKISSDGALVSYEIKPAQGDGILLS